MAVPGSQHLFAMALTAEEVARNGYRGDAYAVLSSSPDGEALLEGTIKRTLDACDRLAVMAAEIRAERAK